MNRYLLNYDIVKLIVLSCITGILLVSFVIPAKGKIVAGIRVEAGSYDRFNTPLYIELKQFTAHPDQYTWAIVERTSRGRIPKKTQLDSGNRLWWILDGPTAAGDERIYELVLSENISDAPLHVVECIDDGKKLTLLCASHPVLSYQHALHKAPEGASELYVRSAFIHPLFSPAGAILTRINPPDHLHHMGLWNPWTKTEFEGRTIDFWNLNKGQGTVRFNSFVSKTNGDVFAGFQALQDHVDLSAADGEKKALSEMLEVRVWNIGEDVWMIDYCSTLSCATNEPFLIKKYRYQGFGFRATALWDDGNCRLITSQGKDKSNANATRARWCDVAGPTETGNSGILFMTNPANYNYPEQLRIWPVGSNNGKENVFFNFNPAQDRDLLIEPNKTYKLQYRMFVYDGFIAGDFREQLWHDYAYPPVVTIDKLK